MATDRYYICQRCGHKVWAGRLLDSLLAVANGAMPSCPTCQEPYCLHLTFALGLDATGRNCSVIDAFLPDEPDKWRDNADREVTFYPFLVITDGENGKGVWLPYWHVVLAFGNETKKYGQWAPFMDSLIFEELVNKARAKGHLGGAT